jgi:hypothetical protein
MNFVLIRLVVWFVTLAVFPVPVTLFAQSFQIEVLQRITFAAALPPRSAPSVDLAERVLVYLEKAEKKEIDPWLRDDIRIAWITVSWAQRGVPEWSWHRDSSPHVAATYQVLRCHPDQVWPRIVALRKVNLGSMYSLMFDDVAIPASPKKPCASERRTRGRQAASRENLAA